MCIYIYMYCSVDPTIVYIEYMHIYIYIYKIILTNNNN